MKSVVIGAAALASFVAKDAEGFFIPASTIGALGATSTSLLSASDTASFKRGAGHGTACTCFYCAPGAHGKSCTCSSCSSAAVSGRTHGAGCRCGACSVRMQAHDEGCGCAECSGTTRAFHAASCKCSACVSSEHEASCKCSACVGVRGRTRAAASLTVMGMGGGESEVSEAFRQRLVAEPESVMFEDTIGAIAEGFDYTPKRCVGYLPMRCGPSCSFLFRCGWRYLLIFFLVDCYVSEVTHRGLSSKRDLSCHDTSTKGRRLQCRCSCPLSLVSQFRHLDLYNHERTKASLNFHHTCIFQ